MKLLMIMLHSRVEGLCMSHSNDNVFSGLNLSFTTWAAGGEVREKSLSVFSNGGMSGSHAGEMST